MRYEQEMLEKIMYYDREGIISTFPLYVYRTKGSVSRKALEAAVGYAIQCHPRFGCRLAEDAKGPYLETNPEQPIIPELNPDEVFSTGMNPTTIIRGSSGSMITRLFIPASMGSPTGSARRSS